MNVEFATPAIVNLMVQYPMTVDRAFAALADPTRRAVLERLGSSSAIASRAFGNLVEGYAEQNCIAAPKPL